MPILYPASLDSLTNPTSSDTLAGVPHATQHSDENDAIEALETKVGVGASTPATPGHVLRVTGPGATAYGAIQDSDIPATIARDSELSAHEADTTNVHGIADTTVLATDAELAAAVDAHTGDASAAHAASAVSVADAGGYFAATDAEAALQEVGPSIHGAWTTFTPTWSAQFDQPVLGNATLNGRYKMLDAKTCVFHIHFVYGSTSTPGTGVWRFALPVTAVSGHGEQVVTGHILDSGTDSILAVGRIESGGAMVYQIVPEGANAVAGTSPIAWATGDQIQLSGIVEVA